MYLCILYIYYQRCSSFTSPTQINIKTFFVNIDIIVKLYDGTPTFLTFTSDVRNARVKLDGYIFKDIYF